MADNIVVKGDPLFNITALADVETVVKGDLGWRSAETEPGSSLSGAP